MPKKVFKTQSLSEIKFHQLMANAKRQSRIDNLNSIKSICDRIEKSNGTISAKFVAEISERQGGIVFGSIRNDSKGLSAYIDLRAREQKDQYAKIIGKGGITKASDIKYYGDDQEAINAIKALHGLLGIEKEKAKKYFHECEKLRNAFAENVEGGLDVLESGGKLTYQDRSDESQSLPIKILRRILAPEIMRLSELSIDQKGNLVNSMHDLLVPASEMTKLKKMM